VSHAPLWQKHDSFLVAYSRRALSLDIVDIKPVNMEELTEVITAAEFHPINCNNFMYSSSKGTIKLADMRAQALCDSHAKRELHPGHALCYFEESSIGQAVNP
jgi:hypothetical protein